MAKTAISPTRQENYPDWYQQVIKAADLAEISPVRGCMVIKPWGYAIWENMQRELDRMFKETGHENAYFPLFIPLSFLQKEADHVEGFAKECAVVTHHRLEPGPDGKLIPAPDAKLEEPLIVRPTSETIIGSMYANWVQSYRDLPILINQWCNVVRWELRTRMFLRTTEFLWQEGHTAHATSEEAQEETEKMLNVYADFVENYIAMPVIKGRKTAGERFPGAVETYTIEAMMQDRKALQAGTSHFLGQNFAKAQDIKFLDQNNKEAYAWTTSWGMTTRLVGALIMTHSDDDGLVLPPRLAPKHIVLLPIYRNDEERSQVMPYVQSLQKEIDKLHFDHRPILSFIDDRDLRGGEKNWQHVKKGVPIRVEVGPKDLAKNGVFVARRDTGEKKPMDRAEFVRMLPEMLAEMQCNLFAKAKKMRDDNTKNINTLDELKAMFASEEEISGGFAMCHFVDEPEVNELLKTMKLSVRCVPIDQREEPGKCVFTGKETLCRGVIAKAY